jgi:hypothetical protein
MKKYLEFIREHKFWKKSIAEFLGWLNEKSQKTWVLLDTETTGLPSDPYEVQLTQIACIVIEYDFETNTYVEKETFNEKIELTEETRELMKNPESKINQILTFNHYAKGNKFSEEKGTLSEFFEFIKKYDDPMLVIQNAQFDMRFLNTRNPIVKFHNEVMDTKQVAQLFFLPLLQSLSYETDKLISDIKNLSEGRSAERIRLENQLTELLKKLENAETKTIDGSNGKSEESGINSQESGIESGETKASRGELQNKNIFSNPFREMVKTIGTSDRDNGLISSSLSKLGPLFKMDMTDYHDALKDCRLMIEMFTKMVDFLKRYQDIDISKYQNERIQTLK